jgi:hypothetical protein
MYDVTAALGALPDVFTAQTAMAAGISHHVLRRLVRHKSIIRFQSGVYGQLRVDEPEQERWARIHREHLVFGWPVSLYPDEPVHLTALRGGATDLLAVEASLDGMRRWRGRPKANAALRLVDPRRESWLESFSFVVLHGLGIDLPTPQVEVFDEWGQFVARRLDAARARGDIRSGKLGLSSRTDGPTAACRYGCHRRAPDAPLSPKAG